MRRAAGMLGLTLALTLAPGSVSAQSCTGRFVNPIADVCWECLFPLSIGPISIGSATGAPDTPNPSSPICLCGSPIPRIGLAVGVWEPARLVDVTRTPWCFPNLGGLTINPGLHAARGRTGSSGGDGAAGSVWHAHLYVYPLLSWIGALLDLGCLESGGIDIAWTSELDPAWLDDELSFLLNPEAALFANLPAQAACAADCTASSVGLPARPALLVRRLPGRDVSAHRQRRGACGRRAGLAARGDSGLLYRLHRAGLAWGTFGSGALCGRYPMPVMKKSQYRWQMTQPVPATSPLTGCNPTGRSSVLWETLRELPVAGENFGYLLWRKRQLLPPVTRVIRMPARSVSALLLVIAAATLAPTDSGTAEEAQSGNADLARRLAEEISSAPAGEALDAWSRTVIDQALDRAAGDAGPASTNAVPSSPVFRPHAGTLGSKGAATAEVLLFTSLAVPAASWRAAVRDAARIGAPLVLRGVAAGRLPAMARRVAARLGDAKAGVAIDPRLFRLFGIARVPAVVVVPGGVPPCRSRGCADDAPPPFDVVTGNLSLAAALEAISAEGSEGRAVAGRHLAALGGMER